MTTPSLPANIDASYADSVSDPTVQAHQSHHDSLHTIYNAGFGAGFAFGNGSDGAAIISSSTMLSRDMHYTDLTVNAGVSLNTGNFRVHASGTLTNNGAIHNNGAAASANAGATYSGNGSNIATLPRGQRGQDSSGIGVAGVSVDGSSGAQLGGGGGGAYANDQVTVRAGGPGNSGFGIGLNGAAGEQHDPWTRLTGVFLQQANGTAQNYLPIVPGSGGASGGGTDTGGGGGGGAGAMILCARKIINNGTISVNGGAGSSRGYQSTGASVNNGGGGGGGGFVFVNCGYFTGSQPTATGGVGGAGMGTGALAGIAGTVGFASVWVMA